MTLNNQAFKLAGVTVDQYLHWCAENKKPAYLLATKSEFFKRIRDGRLVKDSNGNLIKSTKK